jgi:hypothetical protein
LKCGEFTVLIIPSTLQSGRDGIGFVLGNKTSTRSRRRLAAACTIGIASFYIIKKKLRLDAIQSSMEMTKPSMSFDFLSRKNNTEKKRYS